MIKIDNAKIIMIFIFITILLVAGIIIGVLYNNHKKNLSINNNIKLPITFAIGTTSSQKAIYYEDHGSYKQAIEQYNSQLAGANTQTKIGIYYLMSSLATKFKNYSDAKNYALQISKLDPNSATTYVALANMATAQGNKSQASVYWTQAISKLDPNSPMYNIQKSEYQSNQAALK